MTAALLVQLLGSAALATFLAAVINAVMNRKKLGAEATNIITQAASGVVKDLERQVERKDEELDELRAEMRDLKARQERHEDEVRAFRETLQVHAVWDHKAYRLLEECREGRAFVDQISPPPPLAPPWERRPAR